MLSKNSGSFPFLSTDSAIKEKERVWGSRERKTGQRQRTLIDSNTRTRSFPKHRQDSGERFQQPRPVLVEMKLVLRQVAVAPLSEAFLQANRISSSEVV